VCRCGVGWRRRLWGIDAVLQSTAIWYRSDQICKIIDVVLLTYSWTEWAIMMTWWWWDIWCCSVFCMSRDVTQYSSHKNGPFLTKLQHNEYVSILTMLKIKGYEIWTVQKLFYFFCLSCFFFVMFDYYKTSVLAVGFSGCPLLCLLTICLLYCILFNAQMLTN